MSDHDQGLQVLHTPMQPNDAQAATVGQYLVRLAMVMWDEGEDVSGKRPFGNSSWEGEVIEALIRAGLIEGDLDDVFASEGQARPLVNVALAVLMAYCSG